MAEISTLPLEVILALLPMATVASASLSSTRMFILPKRLFTLSETFLPASVSLMASTILSVMDLSPLAAREAFSPALEPSAFSSGGALNTLPVNLVVDLAEISMSPPITSPSTMTLVLALADLRFRNFTSSLVSSFFSSVLSWESS